MLIEKLHNDGQYRKEFANFFNTIWDGKHFDLQLITDFLNVSDIAIIASNALHIPIIPLTIVMYNTNDPIGAVQYQDNFLIQLFKQRFEIYFYSKKDTFLPYLQITYLEVGEPEYTFNDHVSEWLSSHNFKVDDIFKNMNIFLFEMDLQHS